MRTARIQRLSELLRPRASVLVVELIQGPVSKTRRHQSARPPAVLSSTQDKLVRKYVGLLLEKNRVMNLTAVQTEAEAWERHVVDSLALLPVVDSHLADASASNKIIDIGSGAGIPGIILAVARPHWHWTLLDSTRKRCEFLEDVAKALELNNVDVIWARAENAGRKPELREAFDGAIARAVAELRILAELCIPFLRTDGCFIAAKGPSPEEEVQAAEKAIATLGGSLESTELVNSYGPEGQRTAVVVRKGRETPMEYPRREGRPQKKPL